MAGALIRSSIFISFLFCVSCTSIEVKPDTALAPENRTVIVKASVVFDGNRAYLPRTIIDSKGSDIEINYAYKVFYDGTKLNHEIVAGIMPTTLLGLPTGGDEILVVAKLDVRQRQNLVRSYSAEAKVSRPRSLFLGGSDKTEMRKQGLLAVMENLEKQMSQDYKLLSQLEKEE